MRHTLLALSLFAFTLSALAEPPDTYTNDLGMEFALIPAGSFMMGCNASFENCGNGETRPSIGCASPRPFI